MPVFNSYYPASYQNPYQPQYQMYQPTVQQPAAQQLSVQTSQNSIIWVSGDNEAAMYPIAPNNAVTLWSQTEPVVYLKQADASGKPTMKIYDLVERSAPSTASQSKPEDYATKSDLSSIVNIVRNYDDVISTIKADIDTIKSDMYGIAGKKKAAKNTEEADEE